MSIFKRKRNEYTIKDGAPYAFRIEDEYADPEFESILDEAESILDGARYSDYGDPIESHERIAALWSAYLGRTVQAKDVANMMILLKVSRAKGSYKRDSYVDIAGYARIGQWIGE